MMIHWDPMLMMIMVWMPKRVKRDFFPPLFKMFSIFFLPYLMLMMIYWDIGMPRSKMDGEVFNVPPLSNVDDDIGV